MNCEACLLMLDEYIENELDEKSSVQVFAHLDGCASCAGEYELLCREMEAYSKLLPGIEAPPALWTNVKIRVEKAQRERFSLNDPFRRIVEIFGKRAFNPAFAAAAVVVPLALLITLGIIIGVIKYTFPQNIFNQNNEKTVSQKIDIQTLSGKTAGNAESEKLSDGNKQDIRTPEEKPAIAKVKNRIERSALFSASVKPKAQFISSKAIDPNHNPTTAEIIEKANRQYRNAIAILSSDIKRRRSQLAPNLISQFDRSLAELDHTINETKRAVQAQPNDAMAIQYMTTAYAKKIELLRTIAALN